MNDKERTVASARFVLKELKKMEIVHELEKGNIKIKKNKKIIIIFLKIEIVVMHSAMAEDPSRLLLESQSTNPDHLSYIKKKMVRICN